MGRPVRHGLEGLEGRVWASVIAVFRKGTTTGGRALQLLRTRSGVTVPGISVRSARPRPLTRSRTRAASLALDSPQDYEAGPRTSRSASTRTPALPGMSCPAYRIPAASPWPGRGSGVLGASHPFGITRVAASRRPVVARRRPGVPSVVATKPVRRRQTVRSRTLQPKRLARPGDLVRAVEQTALAVHQGLHRMGS